MNKSFFKNVSFKFLWKNWKHTLPILFSIFAVVHSCSANKTAERSLSYSKLSEARSDAPFIEVVFLDKRDTEAYKSSVSAEAMNRWQELLVKFGMGFSGFLKEKRQIIIKLINHGSGNALSVNVPLVVSVWGGRTEYTEENPYVFREEFLFKNVAGHHDVNSETAIDVTYFPFFKISKQKLAIETLPQVREFPEIALEKNGELIFEGENREAITVVDGSAYRKSPYPISGGVWLGDADDETHMVRAMETLSREGIGFKLGPDPAGYSPQMKVFLAANENREWLDKDLHEILLELIFQTEPGSRESIRDYRYRRMSK